MYMRPVRRDLADAHPTYRESFHTICVKWPVADEKLGRPKLWCLISRYHMSSALAQDGARPDRQ